MTCSERCTRRSSRCPTTWRCTRPTVPGRSARPRRARARTTTIGTERATNPLLEHRRRGPVRRALLDGPGQLAELLPSAPRDQPARPPRLPRLPALDRLDLDTVRRHLADGAVLVDARPIDAFAAAHIPGRSRSSTGRSSPAGSGGSCPSTDPSCSSSTTDTDRADLVRQCLTIGHDAILGELDGGIDAWAAAGLPVASIAARRRRHDRRDGARHPPEAEWAPATSRAPSTSSSATSPRATVPGRAGDGDVRPRRTRHDRREPPRSRRPQRRRRSWPAGPTTGRPPPAIELETGMTTSPRAHRAGAPRAAREPGAVRAARRRQRAGRRDDRPGTHRPAAARRARVRAHRVHRRAHVHRRVRRGEGGHQLLRRHPLGPLRPQAGPGRRLAHRHAGAAAADLGDRRGAGSSSPTSCSASTRASPGRPR